jgi:hypothetical protein
MNSFSIPKPLFQTFRVRRIPKASHEVVATEGRVMTKVLGWSATILVVSLLAWQIAAEAPILPRPVMALLLVLISGLAGIRLGTGGAAAYIDDVQRLNRVLAEQHRELEEVNAFLLKELNAEISAPASSEQA